MSFAKKRTRAETFYDKGSHPHSATKVHTHQVAVAKKHFDMAKQTRQDSEKQSMKKKMMTWFTANIQSVHGKRN